MGSRFTFLNSTSTPGLSQSDAKMMRAHITKANFAKRRKRISEGRAAKEISQRVTLTQIGPSILMLDVLTDAPPADLLLATPPKDPFRYAEFRKDTTRLTQDTSDFLQFPDSGRLFSWVVVPILAARMRKPGSSFWLLRQLLPRFPWP
jgi:hypothetical protein